MRTVDAARAVAARRRIRRASGLLREAAADLAADLSDGPDIVGTVDVTAGDDKGRQRAIDLVDAALRRHPAVDVVVLARPEHG